jgi:hypothetical protein
MLSENDIVEIVVNQRHIPTGQAMVNVFHYQAQVVEGDWTDPANFAQFAADIMITMNEVVSAYQTTEISYDSATFRNLTNGLDIGIYIPPEPVLGAVSGTTEPLYVALSFKLNRATAIVRNGSKRFGGIADSFIVDPTGASIAGAANTVAIQDWLAENKDIVAGGGDTAVARPIILRKAAVGVPPTVFTYVASAIYRGAGSQNSRKQLL